MRDAIYIPWLGVEATLSSSGEWKCEDEDALQTLRQSCDPRRMTHVLSVLPRNRAAVHRAVKLLAAIDLDPSQDKPLPKDVIS